MGALIFAITLDTFDGSVPNTVPSDVVTVPAIPSNRVDLKIRPDVYQKGSGAEVHYDIGGSAEGKCGQDNFIAWSNSEGGERGA